MKRTVVIISIALTLLTLYSCVAKDEPPLLMCDFADARQSITVEILLHEQEGDHSCTIHTDEYGMLSYSPEFPGEIAEIEFIHNGRGYGAILQKRKHVKMIITNGDPIFSCDNKECNETCEAIRQVYGKENFIHTDNCPALYEEKAEQLRHSMQKVRQYLANVSDNSLRERLTRRAERIHNEYSQVVDILRTEGNRDEYNRSISGISLYDDNLYPQSSSSRDFYTFSN